MTSFRPGRLVLVVAAFVALLATGVPDFVSYAAEPSRKNPVTTVDATSRAGSRAGEGRERPGRTDLPGTLPPPSTPPPVRPPPKPKPKPVPVRHRDTAVEPTGPLPADTSLSNLRVLPLGGGLVLIGLGLGFLGLRLRRG
ncbi:hypothetical protein [Streptomyces sp. NPDC002564]|uniref:hypothetical protein n=1 Tax=Streptomyces sp. NPDC002564 TaxID=3364649 RepID=UPI0036C7B5F5